jgi:serine/threonine protein kinase
MAPEMVIMLGQTSAEKVGYTNAVDWWSLGVTIFKLLTGFRWVIHSLIHSFIHSCIDSCIHDFSHCRPFSEENFTEFMEMVPTINGRHAPVGLPEYSILFQQIPFPSYMSSDAADLISKSDYFQIHFLNNV